jgi:CheY-like chemotaxis protein
MVVRSLHRMLKDHEVMTAVSGEQALGLLSAGAFDLVLCDLNMPGMDGAALWQHLSPGQRERVIYVTGGSFTDEAQEFLSREDVRVLTKPFTAEQVQSLVRAHLGR